MKKQTRNVPLPGRTQEENKAMWLEVGRTYGRTKGATELAKEFGVSKQRIHQIAGYLRDGGAGIPRIKMNKETKSEVVEILKKENKK